MTPQGERDDVRETPGQERIRRTGLLFELHEGGTFVNEQEILCFADIQAEEVKWLLLPFLLFQSGQRANMNKKKTLAASPCNGRPKGV